MALKYKIFRLFAYAIEVLTLNAIIQTPKLIPLFYTTKPTILLVLAISIALVEGELIGTLFGLSSGIFMDISLFGYIGFYSLSVAILCFFIGKVSRDVIDNNITNSLIVGAVGVFLFGIFEFIFLYLAKGYGNVLYAISYRYIPKLLYTLLFVPVVYLFNRAISSNIREKDDKSEI